MMWDERYGGDGFAYGTEANDFLASVVDKLPANGRALCLAEGEGRNAVFLAQRGFDVVAVDQSAVGLNKARQLAAERGVVIETVPADLEDFEIEPEAWDVIVSIWAHVPPPLRRKVHAASVAGLRPGGCFVLEAYTPEQVGRGTGGPPVPELTMTLAGLSDELAGLEIVEGREIERAVHEGELHNGDSSVVQVLARR
jgi:SAM-dependent methyltransferase